MPGTLPSTQAIRIRKHTRTRPPRTRQPRSRGKGVSSAPLRANRLADALAKLAAQQVSAPDCLFTLLDLASQATKHSGCMLGRVTYLANNHKVTEADETGKLRTTTYRDSVSAPKWRQKKTSGAAQEAAEVEGSSKQKRAAESACLPCGDRVAKMGRRVDQARISDDAHHRKGSASSLHARRTRIEDERQVRRRVDELGSHLCPAVGQPTALQRTQALLDRVRAREGRPRSSSA